MTYAIIFGDDRANIGRRTATLMGRYSSNWRLSSEYPRRTANSILKDPTFAPRQIHVESRRNSKAGRIGQAKTNGTSIIKTRTKNTEAKPIFPGFYRNEVNQENLSTDRYTCENGED